MAETNIANKVNEYYQRTLALKPLISADKDMLSRVLSVAEHVYQEEKLDENIMLLGKGKSNNVYNIGSVIDPETQKEIYIAVRINTNGPLFLNNAKTFELMEKELKGYEATFASEEPVSYFTGVVTFHTYKSSLPAFRAGAFLTEDLSKRGTLPLEDIDKTHVERTNKNGSKEIFYIDPFFDPLKSDTAIEKACSGTKYLEDKARIDF